MKLVETATQSAPPGGVCGEVVTQDRVRIRYARWQATGSPHRGTVVLMQGRTEFIEKYYENVTLLRTKGYDVATFDWRGQGLSQRLLSNRAKGYVRRFDDYLLDLDAVMRDVVLPDCRAPLYAVAHSMGGAILINALTQKRNWFDRVVLSAPMLDLSKVKVTTAMRVLVKALRWIGLGGLGLGGQTTSPVVMEPFEGNALSSDPVRYARFQDLMSVEPDLGLGAPSVAWLDEAFGQMARFADPLYPAALRKPVLIVAAGSDQVVSTPRLEWFGERLMAGRTLVVHGARHELMMEADLHREQFWAAFDAFIPGEAPWR